MSSNYHILECRDVSYLSPTSRRIYKAPKLFQVLKDVSFIARSGELHGIVGVSESGKTSLFQAISNGAGGDIGGIIRLDRFMLTRERFEKYCSFCDYQTNFPKTIKVFDLLIHHAQLHLSQRLTSLQIKQRVKELESMFDIISYEGTKIGDLTQSSLIRLKTVVELLKDPLVILIDNPTIYLQPLSSFQLLYALQYYSMKFNRIVVVSFRSVRSDIYHLLGSITFMYYGEVAYSGKTNELAAFLQNLGYPCPENENPASYAMTLLSLDKETPEGLADTQKIAENIVLKRNREMSENTLSLSRGIECLALLDTALCSSSKASLAKSLAIIIRRNFLLLLSDKMYCFNLLFGFVFMALAVGLLGKLGDTNIALSAYNFFRLTTFWFIVIQSLAWIPLLTKIKIFINMETSIYRKSQHILVFTLFSSIAVSCQSAFYNYIIIWLQDNKSNDDFSLWLNLTKNCTLLGTIDTILLIFLILFFKSISNVIIMFTIAQVIIFNESDEFLIVPKYTMDYLNDQECFKNQLCRVERFITNRT